MPGLHIIADGCAVVATDVGGRPTGNCPQLVAARAWWRFVDRTVSLLLCDVHVGELEGDERLLAVVRFYDATVEDALTA